MRTTFKLAVLCLSLTFIFSSCVSKKKYTELMSNKESLDQMLADSKKKASNLEGDIKTLGEEKDALASDYETSKKEWAAQLSTLEKNIQEAKATATEAEMVAKAGEDKNNSILAEIRKVFSPYEGNGMTLTEKNGRLYISMANPITYKSGSTRVPKAQTATIESLASLLQSNPQLSVLVEGHSDNIPVKAGAAYANNMELSMARANKVVSKLVKLGANSNQLTAVGRGASMPTGAMIDEGYNSEVQSMNRRTEFVVIPNVSSLFKMKETGA